MKRITLLALGLFLSTYGYTASISAQANAELVSAITISESTQLDFGYVSSAANSTCTLGTSADTLSGSGCLSATGSRGSYAITATSSSSLNVTSSAVTQSNVTFTPDIGSSVTTDSSGDGSFYVGGTLSVGSGASDGAVAISYTINVNYP